MKIAIVLFPIILVLSSGTSLAEEPQNSWLIGRWEGNIEGYARRSGPARTLRVSSVAPDGAVEALWSVTGQDEFPRDVMVKGSEVTIIVGVSESSVRLTRDQDDVLAGKFTLKSGEVFPIKLTRLNPSPK
ncbi:MAG: hypothetical protein ACM3TN_05565 [Alphaproteobacteria bacterium]